MAFKILIDTNILIDLLDAKRLNHQAAIDLFNEAENNNLSVFVSESVLNTTAYLVRKDYSVKQIKDVFQHLLSFVEIIPVNNFTYTAGLQMAVNDLEDAILYSAALAKRLDYFITNDIKDLRKIELPALPVMQAKDVLKLI